jgi:hypothetical protein
LAPDVLGASSGREVWWCCSGCGHEWQATISSRALSGSGCPRCYRQQNLDGLGEASRRRSRRPARSLAAQRPELLSELHPTRNGDVDPTTIGAGAPRRLWWRCPTCGHEWQARVNNRVRGTGCPACSGRYTRPEQSLAVLRPDLLAEWHPSRNTDLDPYALSVRSGKRVWWRCSECAHEWQTTVASRGSGTGCSACFRARTVKAPLGISRPDLAAQLHSTRNGDLDPNTIRQWSWRALWWQCPTCQHEWQASPATRSRTPGRGCPRCARRRAARSTRHNQSSTRSAGSSADPAHAY